MEFREFLDEFVKESFAEIVEDLRFIAQGAYEEAMSRRGYKDDTGALSSSIGWAISQDGKILHSGGFVSSGEGGAEGRSAGLKLVRSMASQSKGIQLILVAGMDYASHVEAKGFDVNTAGELVAEELVNWWVSYHA
ncbi:hypothetical protein [Porphyromonas sp. oral taxon 278]|jgi:hypothetical protein|uniref:hypothetical protein n=1 Tax=Porphyromonas sp. oral taxon 278 TaxID=712437 RepID=UPI002065E134|nr:hypothetical protein [Porphyromonas sp. oral taxon 278]DAQ94732.1 MAG TPA: hypothetical protein [Caudoviricetes sp.]